jgi:hypothetical protein
MFWVFLLAAGITGPLLEPEKLPKRVRESRFFKVIEDQEHLVIILLYTVGGILALTAGNILAWWYGTWRYIPSAVGAAHSISLFAMAGAAAMCCRFVQEIGRHLFPPEGTWPRLFSLAGMAAGLSLAFGETAFDLGTTAEVYALQLFFQFAILTCAARVALPCAKAAEWKLDGNGNHLRYLLAGSLLVGLTLSHHRMGIFAGGSLAVALLFHLWDRFKAGTSTKPLAVRVALSFGVFLFGLTPYLYLPIRASANPPLNWGAPDSAERFAWAIRGGEFVEFRLMSPKPGESFTLATYKPFVKERLRRQFNWSLDQMGSFRQEQYRVRMLQKTALLAVLALGGLASLLLAPRGFFVMLPALGGYFLLPLVYNIIDIEGYFLAFWGLALCLMFLGLAVCWRLAEWSIFGRSIHFAPLALLALPMALWWMETPRPREVSFLESEPVTILPAGQDTLPLDWGRRVMDALEPNAIIITEGDNDNFPLLYAQHVLGLREDVTIMGGNFLKEEWYRRYFEHSAEEGTLVIPTNTGGGTPTSVGQYFTRIRKWVVEPARAVGRPVYVMSHLPLHLEEYRKLGRLEEVRELYDEDELPKLQIILGAPPNVLYRLW